MTEDLPDSLCGITDEFFHKDIQYIESPTPPVCLEEETMMGIDEAGRGPVLGRSLSRPGWLKCLS